MTWPANLVLIRHAQSEGNILTVDERARFDRSTHDYDITNLGVRQSEITGAYLKEHYPAFDIFYVSYYRRSRRTMKVMFPDAKVYEDARLAEAQRGIYHTMTQEQIADRFPEELLRKEREDLYHYRPLGGENWADIELRIHSFLGTLSRDYSGKNVVIVVHGHWLLLFQRLIHHFSIEEALRRYKEKDGIKENVSITHYRGGDRLTLVNENIVPWAGQL